MTHPTEPERQGIAPATSSEAHRTSGRWPHGGFALLPFAVERGTSRPATDATWAWSLRRFGRAAVWLLPGYAIVYGSVALVGSGSSPFRTGERPAQLIGWVGALWLGLLSLMALTSLLATSRSRAVATAGLLVVLAGTMLLLPFGALPDESRAFGTGAYALALAGGAVYTAGWLLTGWALLRSGVFSRADGGLLMVAAPLLGVGGMVAAALQALGAVLVLAAGVGVAWRAGRLVPPTGRARLTRPARPGAVAARVAAGAAPAAPLGWAVSPAPADPPAPA